MKKILITLLIISAPTFSASTKPDITGEGKNETPLFKPAANHIGQVEVSGSLKGKESQQKYIIFASVDGRWEGDSSLEFRLPDFQLSQNAEKNIFVGEQQTMKKIYVKKIVSAQLKDLETEKPLFKVEIDSKHNTVERFLKSGESIDIYPTAFISQTRLATIAEGVQNASYVANGYSTTIAYTDESGERFYRTPNSLHFAVTGNGVAEFSLVSNRDWSSSDTLSKPKAAMIEEQFRTGVEIENVSITVKLDTTSTK